MSDRNSLSPFQLILLPGLPVLLLIALYWPALDHEFVWMDTTEIVGGNLILPQGQMTSAFSRPLHVSQGITQGARNPYYRPLQLILVSTIYHNTGLDPRYFRFTALMLGVAYATAFSFLTWLLFKRFAPALLASLLLVAHPVGIEAFAWISGISEAMAGLLITGSLIAALFCMGEPDRTLATRYAVISWLLLVAALLTKEKSVVLPVLVLAMMISLYWAKQPAWAVQGHDNIRNRPASLLLVSLVVTVLGYLMVLRPMVLGSGIGIAPAHDSWIVQWLTALAMWPKALSDLFLPLYSSTSDVVQIVDSYTDPMVWLGLFLGIGSLVVWLLLLRSGRGIAAFGLAWLWIAFLPTANLVPMIHARADRYQFLSVCGAIILVVAVTPDLLKRLPLTWQRAILGTMALAAVAGLAQLTRERLPDWQSTTTLFEHDVAFEPRFREGRFHIALNLHRNGKFREADIHIHRLFREVETDDTILSNINMTGLYQLGCNNSLALGRYGKAALIAERFAETHPNLGYSAGIRDCLGQALEGMNKPREALAVYLAISKSLPGEPPPGLSLAIARTYAQQKNTDRARDWLKRASDQGLDNEYLVREARRIHTLIRSTEK